ncbi:AAA family ATPase [Bacteroides congonensis]
MGIQNYEDLRNNNCVYIDKTALISTERNIPLSKICRNN